mgnify:CR=1 FL=1
MQPRPHLPRRRSCRRSSWSRRCRRRRRARPRATAARRSRSPLRAARAASRTGRCRPTPRWRRPWRRRRRRSSSSGSRRWSRCGARVGGAGGGGGRPRLGVPWGPASQPAHASPPALCPPGAGLAWVPGPFELGPGDSAQPGFGTAFNVVRPRGSCMRLCGWDGHVARGCHLSHVITPLSP